MPYRGVSDKTSQKTINISRKKKIPKIPKY